MRGRKPIPTKLHVLNGNPGKRKLPENTSEELFEAGPIPVPEILLNPENEAAKKEWDRIIPIFEKTGILKTIDSTALATYCMTFQRWVEEEGFLKTEGMLIAGALGGLILNPRIKVIKMCIDTMKAFMGEFGMTPASRVRIKAPEGDKPENPLDKFLGRGKKARA